MISLYSGLLKMRRSLVGKLSFGRLGLVVSMVMRACEMFLALDELVPPGSTGNETLSEVNACASIDLLVSIDEDLLLAQR